MPSWAQRAHDHGQLNQSIPNKSEQSYILKPTQSVEKNKGIVSEQNQSNDEISKSSPVLRPVYGIKTFVLENGLQVYVIENPRIPVVSHTLVYRVGSADDPHGKSGLAHYLEHMMFKGPEDAASAKIWSFTQKVGGYINASTWYNQTTYYEIVPTEYLETIMALEAERMQDLPVIDEQALSERQVIIEERFMRIENNPVHLFFENVNSAFYHHHPYRISPIGWLEEMKGLSAEDVRSFHKKWYTVNNAFLVLSGDITLERAKELSQKYYGAIKTTSSATRDRVQEPPRRSHQIIEMRSAQISEPLLTYVFPSAPYQKDNPEFSDALSMGVFALANPATGWLYQRLVEDLKVANQITIHYNPFTLEHSEVKILISPAQNVALDTLETVLFQELNKFLDTGIKHQELELLKTQMIAGLDFIKDSLDGGSDHILLPLIVDMPLKEIDYWPSELKNLKPNQIIKALKQVFSNKTYLKGKLIPEPTPSNLEKKKGQKVFDKKVAAVENK